MYVVRRAFRNYGIMMAPGSVVEPGIIKRFKSRLNDGHIVEVSEQNFSKWDKYFRERIGVAIKVPTEPEVVNKKPEKIPEAAEKPKQHTEAPKTKAKAVAKVASN